MKINKSKAMLIAAVILSSFLVVAPTFLPQSMTRHLPQFIQDKQISLGLDLRGGAYILLEADLDGVIRERISGLRDTVRKELRGDQNKDIKPMAYSNLAANDGVVSVSLRTREDVGELRRRIMGSLGDEVIVESDGLTLRVFYPEQAIAKLRNDIMNLSVDIVRRRVDSLGNKEPSIARQGDNRIMVQVPGADDPERVKELVGATAKMFFYLVDEEAMMTGRPGIDNLVIDGVIVKRAGYISGENLTDSTTNFDNRTGQPVVTTAFNSLGARQFAKMTTENVGRRFAIVLDGKVLSAPVINEPITGGRGQISGGFDVKAANDLSTMLRSGALPAELTVVEERTVGAGLGADSIRAGEIASIMAMAIVVLFMILFYGTLGAFAGVVLCLNVLLIFAGLAITGATLTLPGIAGIALNIGMAVDACILIFERIREERRAGQPTIRSIENGFNNAFSAIIDSNLTTLAVAFIMLSFGNGPVKGFAITLIIGITTSLFSNITVLRFIMETWARNGKPKEIRI
ncbi:MAG: protein translocase subunit SecD [Alphaproteobacteria bacterium]|nr:protein translocase subunit SecD [Alphaproteobacteria bacterium]